jgi:phenylpropionate dioxygenase-like ring-hydroxylating dioxygenase large terminal subunit
MFLYNAWYVAAWGSEIGEKPLARTLLEEPVVFYRQADGQAVALEDRCCHRGMPLSCGQVLGNNIRCEYHGMVFDRGGNCVEIPGQPLIPKSARVRSFPVAERDGLIWIWMGDASLADPAAIPNYPWHARWPHKCKTERIDCNYLLLSDNLLDQTHAAYVHKSTLASNVDAYERAEMKITPTEDGVKFIRWMLNCQPPGIYAKAVKFNGRVDRWGEFEYVAPSCILQFTGARNVGEGAYENDDRDGGFGLRIFYGITPETEHTSLFMWSVANGHRQNEPQATEELFGEIEHAFKEDEDILVAQYATLRKVGNRPLINIASDGARVHARLALERKIAQERGIPREQVITLA